MADDRSVLGEAGFSDLRIEQFSERLERLLEFVALSGRTENDPLVLPNYSEFRTDGNVLLLDQ